MIKPSLCVVGSFSWLKNILKVINERYSLDFSICSQLQYVLLQLVFQNVIQAFPSFYLT